MKKVLVGLVVMVALVASIAVAWNANGWGDTLSVTGTAQRVEVTGGGVFNMKVVNAGSAAVLVAVNCTAAEFTAITNAGTAMVIAPAGSYPLEGFKDRTVKIQIKSLNIVSSTDSTNTVYLAGW